ncbi:MAG: ATP-grasp domain-containing protein [Lachnospiraceae bacterium]|nr:ATP-grasp domain-containing protein [Lachnospiraceae bacterium]
MKIAIIGASYLQEPLIKKAKEMGHETHVFAWEAGDPGEKMADHFYPISIIEKEMILEECRRIGIDGICSIASDLAVVTVNYVAEAMGLISDPDSTTLMCTNKSAMRDAFKRGGDPSPASIKVSSAEESVTDDLKYPLIVKPSDRSGSRAVKLVIKKEDVKEAVSDALEQSFCGEAVIEEYVSGQEYSVEGLSFKGKHRILQVTRKFTTSGDRFIETAHLEPSGLDPAMYEKVEKTVIHALSTLGKTDGASHSELRIDEKGNINLIEIGARMGGDCIGSSLVELSTGIDYVKAVIDIALGKEPDLTPIHKGYAAAIRYILDDNDIQVFKKLSNEHPEYIVESSVPDKVRGGVTDSSTRSGYFIIKAEDSEELLKYLPG